MPRYWIVVCPEPHVQGGVWDRWYRENCVAIGWPPNSFSLDGPTESHAWAYTRERLKLIDAGDKVVPFLLRWRIGPVGTVTEVRASDTQWNPTVETGKYSLNLGEPELGRRVIVNWDQGQMPPGGRIAVIPLGQRARRPLARHTIEELAAEQFGKLQAILVDSSNWADLTVREEPEIPEEPRLTAGDGGISVLERDLQKFISRNLHVIELGLKAHQEYQLEEFPTDVGFIDLMCQDLQNNPVVIELKAGAAGDAAVGQILGYMAWVRDNLPDGSKVRGILICKNPTDRIISAAKLVPGLSIKRFKLSFSIENAS